LHSLVTEIIIQLKLDKNKISQPSATELETNTNIFSRQFLPKIYEALQGKKLVLLLKEFNALEYDNSNTGIEQFCLYLNVTNSSSQTTSRKWFLGKYRNKSES
jgi:hypothetical protein